jgi:uncharacterized phage-like protein YoqJ
MITIAITGHRPDSFLVSHYDQQEIKRIVNDIAVIFKREHKEELCFNLGGAVGADLWMGQACLENKIKYHLYLPFSPETQSKFWEDEHKALLEEQMRHAVGIDIINPSGYDISDYQTRNEKMVDNSNFVVAFWVGKRRGGTYNCIKYALEQSKFVFNALDSLKPIFKDNLRKGWTPPTMKH